MAASEKKRERPRAAAAGLAALGVAAVAAVAARLLHRHHHKRQEQGLGAAPTVPSPPRPASPEQRHEPTSPKAIARAAVPAAPTAEQAPEQAPETPPAAAAGGDAGAAAGGQVEAEEAGEGKPAKRPAEEGSKQSEEDQPAAEIAQLPTAVPAGSTAAGPSTATAAQQEQEQEPGDAERLLELNRRLPGAPEASVVWAAWGLPPAAEREGLMLRAGSRILRALSLSTRDDEPEQSDFEACWALAGTLPPVEDRAGLLRLANMAGVRLDDAALEAAPPGQPLGPQAQQRLAELRRRLERAWELRRIMLCAAAIKDPDLRGRAILRLGLGPPRVALAPLALLSKTVLEGMLLDDWEYLQAVGSDAREFVSSGQLDAVLKDALG